MVAKFASGVFCSLDCFHLLSGNPHLVAVEGPEIHIFQNVSESERVAEMFYTEAVWCAHV